MSIINRILWKFRLLRVPDKPGRTPVKYARAKLSEPQVQPSNASSILGQFTYIPRRGYERENLDNYETGGYSVIQLLTMLAYVNPEFSVALWNTVRLGNTEFKTEVMEKANPEQPNEKAKKELDNYINSLNKRKGGLHSIIGQMFTSWFLQGAICFEVVPKDKEQPFKIITVNPYSIYFKYIDGKYVPYQYQFGKGEKKLDETFFWYIPFDPMIDDPYGKPPSGAAINDVFFYNKWMYNLRRVLETQAIPHLSLKIMTEALKNAAPPDVKADPKAFQEFIEKEMGKIETEYQNIKADDAIIHTDTIEVSSTDTGTKLFDIKAVMDVLERKVTRGLKQLPVFMGNNEGTTETHGTVQETIYFKALSDIQRIIKQALREVFELYLQYLGYQVNVKVEFEEIKTTSRLLDAQAKGQEILNAQMLLDLGFINSEQASIDLTGSKPPEVEGKIATKPTPIAPEDIDEEDVELDFIGKKNLYYRAIFKPLNYPKGGRNTYFEFRGMIRENFKGWQKTFPISSILENIKQKYPQEKAETRTKKEFEAIYVEALNQIEKEMKKKKYLTFQTKLSNKSYPFLKKFYELQAVMALGKLDFKVKKFNLTNPGIVDFLKNHTSEFAHSVYETNKKEIAGEIYKGFKQNMAIDQVARNVRTRFADMTVNRSQLIARTEMGYTRKLSNLDIYKKMGVTKIEWLTAGDERVRDEHVLNESAGPIPLGSVFPSGADAAPDGPNCRCDILPVVEESDNLVKEPWQGE